MKIVGINGFKRSGKGETALAAERLLRDDGATTRSVGFADKLKILAAKSLGFTDLSDAECIALMDEAKEDWVMDIYKRNRSDMALSPYGPPAAFEFRLPVTQITGREFLQHLGNQAREVFGADFWVDQVLPHRHEEQAVLDSQMEYRYPDVDVLLITDLRYENEARRIKSLGGVIWEVLRPGTASDGHASEKPLPNGLVDWQIFNDGTLTDLEDHVVDAITECKL